MNLSLDSSQKSQSDSALNDTSFEGSVINEADPSIALKQENITSSQKDLLTSNFEGNQTFKSYDNWTFEEICRFSEEVETHNGGLVSFAVTSPLIKDGQIYIKFNPDDTNVFCEYTSEEEFLEILKLSAHFSKIKTLEDYKTHLEEGIILNYIRNEDGSIRISLFFNQNFPSNSLIYWLREIGLGSMIRSRDTKPSKAQIDEMINNGELNVTKNRKVLIRLYSSKEVKDLIIEGQSLKGKKRFYHGTNIESALSIARIGFFGLTDLVREHPTLSSVADQEVVTTAQYRASELNFGAIVVLDCEPDEVKEVGGLGETIAIPTKSIVIDRRLKNILPGHFTSNNDIGFIPPERISKIILVPN